MDTNKQQSKEFDIFCQNWGLPTVTFPPPLALPEVKPPVLGELEETPQHRRELPQGLFKQMLQADPSTLLEMLGANPAEDLRPAVELLEELQGRIKRYESLSPDERDMLDEATVHALCAPTSKRTKPVAKHAPTHRRSERTASPMNHDSPSPFWWL